MLVNALIILVCICLIAYVAYRYITSLSHEREDDSFEDDYRDIKTIKDKIVREFNGKLKQDFREKNMTKTEYEQKQKSKAYLRKNLKEAAYGNSKAKKNIKMYIKSMLIAPEMNFDIDEHTINGIIPFEKEEDLKNQDKFEIVLYIAYNLMLNEEGKALRQNGFAKVIKDYRLTDPVKVDGEWMYDFGEERLAEVYHDLISKYELTFNDKLEILSQRIFEMFKGFGVVDGLFDTGVDEIDAGISGVSKDGYEIQNSAKNQKYSYQSIWIIVGGIKLQLSCLSFGSQEELIRVVSNIYKYGANRVLSKKTGYVQSTMKNGSRVVVARPPFCSSYAFLARKFDSAPSIAPEKLIRGNNNDIPLLLIKWLIKGQRNIAITGDQGTGKTTMLKALVRFIDAFLSIRVQEKAAELNLNYAYPNRNIMAFQETQSIDSQEGLNIQKKTSGDVNIIGEVAEAIQANFVIQTAMVASLFAIFSHHAKTTFDLVLAIANNLLDPVCGIYREKKEAVEMAAKVLNIDIHCCNVKGDRHLERITEIIPVKNVKYPSEIDKTKTHEDDELEYWIRQTDRLPFKENQLMHYEKGEFVLDNLPSEEMMLNIRSKLTEVEEQQFIKDMEYIKNLKRNPLKEDIFQKNPLVLNPEFAIDPEDSKPIPQPKGFDPATV